MAQPPNISYARLLEYAAGELGADDASVVEAYLRENPSAAETVRLFRAVTAIGQTADSVAPPPSTLAAAKALFRTSPSAPAGETMFEALRRVVSALVFDSRTETALVGLRGGNASYQLSYESEAGDVDVEVSSAAEDRKRIIRGQASLHERAPVETVALAHPGTTQAIILADADATGMFTLTAAPGRYDLLVAAGGALVVMPDVEIE